MLGDDNREARHSDAQDRVARTTSVLSRRLSLAVPANDIRKTKALMTIVGGKIVYRDGM